MGLDLETVVIGGQTFYSVINKEDNIARLVLQTTNRVLARLVVESNWTDGTKIPKEVMEGPRVRT